MGDEIGEASAKGTALFVPWVIDALSRAFRMHIRHRLDTTDTRTLTDPDRAGPSSRSCLVLKKALPRPRPALPHTPFTLPLRAFTQPLCPAQLRHCFSEPAPSPIAHQPYHNHREDQPRKVRETERRLSPLRRLPRWPDQSVLDYAACVRRWEFTRRAAEASQVSTSCCYRCGVA